MSTTDLPLRVAALETLDGIGKVLLNTYALTLLTGVSRVPHDPANLYWMWKTASQKVMIWPVDKTSRWIGFIQGVLAVAGTLDVKEERDRTRPIFHKAYDAMGYNKPESQEHSPEK